MVLDGYRQNPIVRMNELRRRFRQPPLSNIIRCCRADDRKKDSVEMTSGVAALTGQILWSNRLCQMPLDIGQRLIDRFSIHRIVRDYRHLP